MKKLIFIFTIILISLALAQIAYAHCPLCTAAAGGGVAVARFYGVNDSIIGLFLGAVIISSALWFNKWLRKRVKFPFQETLIVIGSFLMFAIPFYFSGLITNFSMVKSMPDHHSIWGLGVLGIDSLLFGMIIGSLAILGTFTLSENIKKKKGKLLYPYQGISFMLIVLIILTFIFLLTT